MSDDSTPSDAAPPKRQPKCPICGRVTQQSTRPFCSARCADVDLSRWLGGGYAIAGHEDAEEDETVTADSIARRLAVDDDDEDKPH
jgi:uncharacterized protein